MSTLEELTSHLRESPETFSPEQIDTALTLVLKDPTTTDDQIAAFLTASRETGIDRTAQFISTTVANLRKEAHRIRNHPEDLTFLDIVGTGGDGRNTFNVSTTSAIVASGVPEVRVAKHGGPASTSTSGASDLLSNLGINLSMVNQHTVGDLLGVCDFAYMSGPVFHPLLARVKPVRKSLKFPTIFNLVGPLLNPASIRARVLGVFTPSLGLTYAESARALYPGTRALVVCGAEGLDEISPAGPTHVWELLPEGEIKEYTISPTEDFGLPTHELSEVASGKPEENAQLVLELVNNKLPAGHPIRDYVLLNTAGLLYICGAAKDFKEGVKLAAESIESGAAKLALETFVNEVGKL